MGDTYNSLKLSIFYIYLGFNLSFLAVATLVELLSVYSALQYDAGRRYIFNLIQNYPMNQR